MDNEAITILKNSVAKGASDEELKFCLTVARRYKLDPFKQQIWFIKRWDKNADNGHGGTGAYIWVPQVGIYGLLHIAARDHKDYEGISETEYGPMIEIDVEGKKIRGPEYARVKVWKKGSEHPTIGEAYFDEYCPKRYENTLFWRTMGRRMISKCAKAQGVREACPDLGGLKIPEEMERMNEDYAPSGRQIIFADEKPTVTPESNEAIQSLKARGLWCQEHACVRNARHLEVCDSSRKATAKSPEVQPESQPAPIQEAPKPKPAKKEAPKPIETKYELTIDWSLDRNAPVLTGHLEELGVALSNAENPIKMIWGKDELWHAAAKDVPAIMQVASQNAFLVKEIQVNQVPPGGQQRSAPPPARKPADRAGAVPSSAAPTAGPSLISGTVEQANPESGKSPRMSVLFKTDGKKYWMKAWSDKLFPWLVKAKEKNLPCEILIEKRQKDDKTFTNIVGLKRIGSQEFDEDGKTPCIQNKDREAGGPTLFNA